MPRPRRFAPGGMTFHVLNRSVGRRTLFASASDYVCFIDAIAEALHTRPMRICSYCVMPNHWHMVLWPERDGDLSDFVQHVTNVHVKRWKFAHDEIGYGHLYQGRFKSFPVQTESYFYSVVRYVERNPLRANLVARAENWPWSSLGQPTASHPIALSVWPVPGSHNRQSDQWIEWVNRPHTEQELTTLRTSAARGRPFGDEAWVNEVAGRLNLGPTIRPRGRPRGDRSGMTSS